jgi:high-affinity Fe2+/Pb2+ permease
MEITQNELIIYGAIAGTIVGLVLGLVLLFLGVKKNKRKLGIIGFIVTFLIGPVSGLLSLISAGVFFWFILRKTEQSMPENISADANETSENETA